MNAIGLRVTNPGAVTYMGVMDDVMLLAASERGDAEAFALFYRRHLPLVVAFAVKATGDREAAADLTVERCCG